jgi:hypothetical protein
MTTVQLSNEPRTGKPRFLNVVLNNINLTYSVDLKDTDGSVIIEGKSNSYYINSPTMSTTVDPIEIAKIDFEKAIADAYITLYTAING